MFTALAVLAAAQPVAAQTVQQRFDAATEKLNAKDLNGAIAELDALEAFLLGQPKKSETNLAVTRAMKAEALINAGRGPDAKAALAAALAGPWLDKPALATVRDNAWLLRARLHEGDLEHAEASALYLRVAKNGQDPMARANGLLGAARSKMLVDPAAALAYVDEALKIAESDASVGKEQLANVLGQKGRILINAGRHQEARDLLVRAVGLSGGLTPRTNLAEVALRADAAIAMLHLGHHESARRYLAFSGAGHSPVQLMPPVEAELPPCGGESGLEPDDWAVIEFTILDDGRVVSPRPIFASRHGDMAYTLARAVGDWSWEPKNAREVNLFYRASARAEVRCSNAMARPSLLSEYRQAAADWLASQGAPMLLEGASAERASALSEQLKSLPPNDRSHRRLAVLAELGGNPSLPNDETRAWATEALTLARELRAPPKALFALAYAQGHAQNSRARSWRSNAGRMATMLQGLLDWPEFSDPRIRATILTLMGGELAAAGKREEEMAVLAQVAGMQTLDDRDPLKVAALVALANAHAARKDMAAAQAAYARTGLTAQQCALLDNGPVMTSSGSGSFPPDVLEWGFDGWTLLEYDVAADGRTRGARTVAAFPPQLFNEASESLARSVRYRVSYRPESDLACTAMRRRVRFSNRL